MTYRELNQIFYENNKFDTPNYIINLEPFFYDCRINTKYSTPIEEPIPVQTQVPVKELVHIPMPVQVKETVSIQVPIQIPMPVPIQIPEQMQVPIQMPEQIQVQVPMPVVNSTIIRSKNDSSMFEPKQSDSIFWCVFVFTYGYGEYLMVGSKYGNRELEEKQKMITQFKTNPKSLKTTNHKITNGNIQEIYSEFMAIQNETSLMGVIALTVFYDIRILLVDASKKTYLDFHTSNNDSYNLEKTCVLYKNKGIRGKTKYTIHMSMTDEMIQTIQKTMLCLDGYNRALRSISSYKIGELEDICNLLGLITDINKRAKKDELYNRINEHCVMEFI